MRCPGGVCLFTDITRFTAAVHKRNLTRFPHEWWTQKHHDQELRPVYLVSQKPCTSSRISFHAENKYTNIFPFAGTQYDGSFHTQMRTETWCWSKGGLCEVRWCFALIVEWSHHIIVIWLKNEVVYFLFVCISGCSNKGMFAKVIRL